MSDIAINRAEVSPGEREGGVIGVNGVKMDEYMRNNLFTKFTGRVFGLLKAAHYPAVAVL